MKRRNINFAGGQELVSQIISVDKENNVLVDEGSSGLRLNIEFMGFVVEDCLNSRLVDFDVQTWLIKLEERWDSHPEVGVFWLVVSESVIDWRVDRCDITVINLLIITRCRNHLNFDQSWLDILSVADGLGGKIYISMSLELEKQFNALIWIEHYCVRVRDAIVRVRLLDFIPLNPVLQLSF